MIHIKDEQRLRYNMKIWHKNDAFDILKKISESLTLVQLLDSLGNVNHAISIVGYWVFDSNYDKVLCLTKESLDLIFYPSIREEQVATIQSIFYAVRYMWAPINLKI